MNPMSPLQIYAVIMSAALVGVILLFAGEALRRQLAERRLNKCCKLLASCTGQSYPFDLGMECPECGGSPFTADGEPCHHCEGLGRVPTGLDLELRLVQESNRLLQARLRAQETDREALMPLIRLIRGEAVAKAVGMAVAEEAMHEG